MLNKRILITGIGNSGLVHSLLADARFLESRDAIYLVMVPPPEPKELVFDPMEIARSFRAIEKAPYLRELFYEDGQEVIGPRRIRTAKERRKASKRRKIANKSKKLNNRKKR